MTRKDYVALAGAIRDAMPIDPPAFIDSPPTAIEARRRAYEAISQVAVNLADVCAENPRFDRERFLKAAGVAR